MAFCNSQHLSSFGGAAEQNSIGVAGCQRFCAGMDERLEFSSKAHFSGPLVGAVVPFNAVHLSSTEDPQLDEAASGCSLTTSQLRDHVFDWRPDMSGIARYWLSSSGFDLSLLRSLGLTVVVSVGATNENQHSHDRGDHHSGTNAHDAVRGTDVDRVQVFHAGEANGVLSQ